MRWVPVALILVAFAPGSAAAQSRQLVAMLDVYECVEVSCTIDAPCDTNGGGICTELFTGSPICLGSGHLTESYCCEDQNDCPRGTTCTPVEDQAFGVCLGPGVPGYCTEMPTTRDLERCRQGSSGFSYDWGHGDCDGDGERNDVDETLCTSTPRCYCDPDVNRDAGDPFTVDLTDASIITMCIRDASHPACGRADINCDGMIDYCDVSAARRAMNLGLDRPEPFVCDAVQCGNCLTAEGCVRSGRAYCIGADALGGTFFGDTDCDERIELDGGPGDGGPADGSTSDGALRDSALRDGALRDTSARDADGLDGLSFRGAGGCACRIGHAPSAPPPLLALAMGALIVLRRSRRRR